jgi:DNA-directed RNA polymerase subunit F
MKPVSLPEVKELLEERPQPASPVAQRILVYVSTFSKLDAESARKLKQELMERFGLEEVEAVQVVNICPRTVEEVRTVLSGYKRLLLTVLADEEKMRGIADTVRRYVESASEGSS